MHPFWWAAIAAGGLLLLVVGIYAILARLQRFVREAKDGIESELALRNDLIGHLIEASKSAVAPELLNRLTAVRERMAGNDLSLAELADRHRDVIAPLKSLLAAADLTPSLKSGSEFARLRQEIANAEDRIRAARRYYNASAEALNRRIARFPFRAVAALFRFRPVPMFEIAGFDVDTK